MFKLNIYMYALSTSQDDSSATTPSRRSRLKPHRTEFRQSLAKATLATVTPPIEPEDYSYSQPDFFMHAYAGGKRAYKAFNCQRCTKVVRVDQMPAKGVWKCAGCIKRLVAGAMDED